MKKNRTRTRKLYLNRETLSMVSARCWETIASPCNENNSENGCISGNLCNGAEYGTGIDPNGNP